MTLGFIASAAAPASEMGASAANPASTIPPDRIVVTQVTPVMPPGTTETKTTKADGEITTVVTNAAGAVVAQTIATATMQEPDAIGSVSSVNLWA